MQIRQQHIPNKHSNNRSSFTYMADRYESVHEKSLHLLTLIYGEAVNGIFPATIFLLTNANPRATDAREIRAAVRNMRLYASGVGNCSPTTPSTVPWYICWNIAAIDGPIDIPIRLRSSAIPSAIPVICIGADRSTTLKPPVIESDSPAEIIVSETETMNSVEWNISKLKNPIALIIVPNNVSRVLPTLFKMKPDITVPTNKTIINGSCTFAVTTASPPKPRGGGLLTIIGIVWYTMNMQRKTNIRMILAGRIIL